MYVDTPFSLAQNGQRIQKSVTTILSASPALQSSDFGEGKFFLYYFIASSAAMLAQDDFF